MKNKIKELRLEAGYTQKQLADLALVSSPIWIMIPCHRVIGKDGGLTGYAGGLAKKSFLLDLERKKQWGEMTRFETGWKA